MLNFGWKAKALQLRTVILSAGHQVAKEMPVGIVRVLDLYRRVHDTKDPSGIAEEIERINKEEKPDPLLWEPATIAGWDIQAAFYLKDGDLWWLFHAQRKTARAPSEGNIALLERVLEEFGADPKRHVIIGPRSGPGPQYEALPFGWWTWKNTLPLLEMHVHKGRITGAKADKDAIRIVPSGSRATDGYEKVDLTGKGDDA